MLSVRPKADIVVNGQAVGRSGGTTIILCGPPFNRLNGLVKDRNTLRRTGAFDKRRSRAAGTVHVGLGRGEPSKRYKQLPKKLVEADEILDEWKKLEQRHRQGTG
jgi:hypothetical protein